MRYTKIDNTFIDLRAIHDSLETLLIEVKPNGTINREIGLNSKDQIIHKYPSKHFQHGRYGILDLVSISLSQDDKDAISRDAFEGYWGLTSSP